MPAQIGPHRMVDQPLQPAPLHFGCLIIPLSLAHPISVNVFFCVLILQRDFVSRWFIVHAVQICTSVWAFIPKLSASSDPGAIKHPAVAEPLMIAQRLRRGVGLNLVRQG